MILGEGAIIESVLSSLISAVFVPGPPGTGHDIERALGRLGPNVRAVYHYGEYMRGLFGSHARMTYGTLVPEMSTILEVLLCSEFGTAIRLGR
ncbi:conserved protein of unknown function [Bradyrhizobium sp. ORS 285]|nr:conserved hypothetical protein [Bradyrhizobium sp. ORS 285]SMX60735.1 conserved protein of unknown function [Bradyrhizobium sp. ORS 285]